MIGDLVRDTTSDMRPDISHQELDLVAVPRVPFDNGRELQGLIREVVHQFFPMRRPVRLLTIHHRKKGQHSRELAQSGSQFRSERQ